MSKQSECTDLESIILGDASNIQYNKPYHPSHNDWQGNQPESRMDDGGIELMTTINHVSATRTRLVNDVHESMTPATCRKNNRSLSTRKKNLYEGCRLIMWLYGIHNNENGETRRRLKQLLDDRLLDEIDKEVDKITGAKTDCKKVQLSGIQSNHGYKLKMALLHLRLPVSPMMITQTTFEFS